MKYFQFLFFFIFIFAPSLLWANEYNNGNGTILDQYVESGYSIVIRRQEQRFSISPYGGSVIAYEGPNENTQEVFRLNDGDYINTLQLAHIRNLSTNEVSNWIKIIDDNNRIGWLKLELGGDLYRDDIWTILEVITINDSTWTIRKMDGGLIFYSYNTPIGIRDTPGYQGTEILFQLEPPNEGVEVTILAIAEEAVISNDRYTEYWIKIKDDQNRIGWVLGSYGSRDMGGPKYNMPHLWIEWLFNTP